MLTPEGVPADGVIAESQDSEEDPADRAGLDAV